MATLVLPAEVTNSAGADMAPVLEWSIAADEDATVLGSSEVEHPLIPMLRKRYGLTAPATGKGQPDAATAAAAADSAGAKASRRLAQLGGGSRFPKPPPRPPSPPSPPPPPPPPPVPPMPDCSCQWHDDKVFRSVATCAPR